MDEKVMVFQGEKYKAVKPTGPYLCDGCHFKDVPCIEIGIYEAEMAAFGADCDELGVIYVKAE